MKETHQLIHQSKSREWYTPKKYIDAVHQLLGEIDCDPASCEYAQRIVNAKIYYTQEDNGLTQSWYGRIFLNPPYGKDSRGKSNQETWTRYLIKQHHKGNTKEAILLVSACTSEKWFQVLWEYPICFVNHRISFYGPPDQAISGNTKGSCFVYFGNRSEVFSQIFKQFGPVILPETLIRNPQKQLSFTGIRERSQGQNTTST